MKCPKCKATSGDDWTQCEGSCPMPGSPYYKKGCKKCGMNPADQSKCEKIACATAPSIDGGSIKSREEVLAERKKESDDIQLAGFDEWFYKMLHTCTSCLTRDVLRNQKQTLREEWLKVRPMIDHEDYERDDKGRVKQ